MRQRFVHAILTYLGILVIATCLTATAGEGNKPSAPGPGVLVVGLGEPLLAGEAEAFLEGALKREGLRLVDERGLPEADAALGDRSGPLTRELLEAVKPEADTLVLVRAEYLGGRPLQVDERSDQANQARLTVTLISLSASGSPVSLVNERVEYTSLTAADAVQRVLHPCLPELLKLLGKGPR
jgi:hypothetical protein